MSNFKVGDLCDFLGMAVVIKAHENEFIDIEVEE